MSVYELSNYLFVCEKHRFTGFGGCGRQLLVEQQRSIKDAAEYAADNEGWYTSKPGEWDDDRTWQTLCAACACDAPWRARRAEASVGSERLKQ